MKVPKNSMLKISILTLLGSASLMACQPRAVLTLDPPAPSIVTPPTSPTPPTVVQPSPVTPSNTTPTNSAAGELIGSAEPTPSRAAQVFSDICISGNSPAASNLVQEPSTGSWVDPTYNIAVRDTGSVCAIIFGSNSSQNNVQLAFPGEEEGINPIRATGATKFGQPLYAAAYTRT